MSYKICDDSGPCWKGYVYVGPKPGVKGSCIKKEKICKSASTKYTKCKVNLNCNNTNEDEPKIDYKSYNKCLKQAYERFLSGDLNLCPEGYCTAKQKFEVYPSAYANGYASQVCKGTKPNLLGIIQQNEEYIKKLAGRLKKKNNLKRWYKEQWVNVCEKGNGPGGYAICGSGEGIDNPTKYPYCRAYYKLPGTTVVTAPELTSEEIKLMCKTKRSLKQGVDGNPTRIILPKPIRTRVKNNRKLKGGNYPVFYIPKNVRDIALNKMSLD